MSTVLVDPGCEEDTYVRASALNISCASLVTPFPFIASASFSFLTAASSLALSALRSTLAIGGWAFSNVVFSDWLGAGGGSARIAKL